MGEKNNCIIIIVDGNYKTAHLKKTITSHDDEADMDVVGLQMIVDGIEYKTPHSNWYMENAVMYLQNVLPEHIDIACCQSCRHGNFCPVGDFDDKIFCLLGYKPHDKADVAIILHKNRGDLPRYELLHWCDRYEKIDTNKYYTYNDWEYHLKKINSL